MQRRFRQVCTSLKERSFMSYAKIAAVSGFSDMNIIIIKATAPDDLPLHEKYIHRLLKLFSISPTTCHSFAVSFTRRFGTTRSWRVALKCLILLHRLLRSVPGKSTLWSELLWTRSNALISLHPCHFKDESSSCPVSYTNFVASYAHLLDEALNCVALDDTTMEGREVDEKEEPTAGAESFHEKMKGLGEVLEILPQLQSFMDRVMQCYPVGVASRSLNVQCAMKLIIRDSFVCYTKFRREIVGVMDNLLDMPYRNCIAAFNIYKKAAVQTNELYEFYEWCKVKGMCGLHEYPLVEPIPYIQIKALENFLSGMWQLTESSSPITSPSSSAESPSDFTERQVVTRRDTVDIKGKVFEAEEEKPLIEQEREDDENLSWETLLESSVSFSHAYQRDLCSFFYQLGWEGGFGIEQHGFNPKEEHKHEHADDTMNIAVYNSPTATHNPFSEPYCCSPHV
ncbi:putative clathrin assembly protein At4g25940 [Vigna unguiculata]|uniref:putative clathrin assembly protein At4g25940 n=1 Tax=Vigna unguiculata TaxID=3917 RepID=UPI001016E624|nr:putative clathrin assembly protein At4g25940 [Vigna unguiculata]